MNAFIDAIAMRGSARRCHRLAPHDRPVLVGVAKRDSIVPAHFGVTLYEALADPKRLAVIVSADHNNWVDYIDATWWQVATSFLLDGAAPP